MTSRHFTLGLFSLSMSSLYTVHPGDQQPGHYYPSPTPLQAALQHPSTYICTAIPPVNDTYFTPQHLLHRRTSQENELLALNQVNVVTTWYISSKRHVLSAVPTLILYDTSTAPLIETYCALFRLMNGASLAAQTKKEMLKDHNECGPMFPSWLDVFTNLWGQGDPQEEDEALHAPYAQEMAPLNPYRLASLHETYTPHLKKKIHRYYDAVEEKARQKNATTASFLETRRMLHP